MPGATLAFDTSGPHCTAALVVSGEVVDHRFETITRGQAERLLPMLEEILNESGLGWPDVARVGVGVGPGNFTGIRISVAAARGLALSLDRPAFGISTLDALACGLPRPLIACVAGRRDTIYIQSHERGVETAPAMTSVPLLDTLRLPRGALCVGEPAEAVAEATCGRTQPPAQPLAVALANLADARSAAAPGRPTPLYLRPADAAPSRDDGPTRL